MTEEPLLKITADIEQLARVRQFIREAGMAHGAGEEAVEDLVLAVDEAVTNIILHGYGGGPGTIEIEVNRSGDAVQVRLRDHAPLFDPTQVPAPNLNIPLEERPLGGMGIFLMKNMVDAVSHRATDEGGNELTLVKHG